MREHGGLKSGIFVQTIDGLEADVARGKKDTGTQAESAAEAAKALAAAERRLESAAAQKADSEQRMAELKQQLAPFEGRVQTAVAETKVPGSLESLPFLSLQRSALLVLLVETGSAQCRELLEYHQGLAHALP